MKKYIAIIGALLMSAAVVSPAQAQNFWYRNQQYSFNTNNINRVQLQLENRIQRGIHSGRISQQEAMRLRNRLAQIDQAEARMRASGGRLTFAERQRLSMRLANASSAITRDLNDFERRRVNFYGYPRSIGTWGNVYNWF